MPPAQSHIGGGIFIVRGPMGFRYVAQQRLGDGERDERDVTRFDRLMRRGVEGYPDQMPCVAAVTVQGEPERIVAAALPAAEIRETVKPGRKKIGGRFYVANSTTDLWSILDDYGVERMDGDISISDTWPALVAIPGASEDGPHRNPIACMVSLERLWSAIGQPTGDQTPDI